MGVYGFTISNPETSKDTRKESIPKLLEYVHEEIRNEGIIHMTYATDKHSLQIMNRLIKNFGWKQVDDAAVIGIWSDGDGRFLEE